jgi:hypothetical protein
VTFTLEVYGRDEEHLGTVITAERYAQAILEGEAYPFRNVEAACMALLAWHNARARAASPEGGKAGSPTTGNSVRQVRPEA